MKYVDPTILFHVKAAANHLEHAKTLLLQRETGVEEVQDILDSELYRELNNCGIRVSFLVERSVDVLEVNP